MVPNLAKHHNVNIVDITTNIPILNDIISVRRYYVKSYAEDCERPFFGLPLVLEILDTAIFIFIIIQYFQQIFSLTTQNCTRHSRMSLHAICLK